MTYFLEYNGAKVTTLVSSVTASAPEIQRVGLNVRALYSTQLRSTLDVQIH